MQQLGVLNAQCIQRDKLMEQWINCARNLMSRKVMKSTVRTRQCEFTKNKLNYK